MLLILDVGIPPVSPWYSRKPGDGGEVACWALSGLPLTSGGQGGGRQSDSPDGEMSASEQSPPGPICACSIPTRGPEVAQFGSGPLASLDALSQHPEVAGQRPTLPLPFQRGRR